MCCRYTFFFELKTNHLFYATIKTFGPSFSEKLKFGVGGNTLIKAKKKSIYARGRSYRDSVLNVDAEPKPLFFNMKNKFSGITGWD